MLQPYIESATTLSASNSNETVKTALIFQVAVNNFL